GEGVQAVEQEMRIELHSQGIESSAVQLCLKLGGVKLAIAQFPVLIEGVDEAQDTGVNKHVPVKQPHEHALEHLPPFRRLVCEKPEPACAQDRVQERHGRGAKHMKRHSRPPSAAINGKALREAEYHDGKYSPRVPVHKSRVNLGSPADGRLQL